MMKKFVLGALFLMLAWSNLYSKKDFFEVGSTGDSIEYLQATKDTLVKTSDVFRVNGIGCYWTHYLTDDETRMVLKNHQTNEVLIDTDFVMSYWLTQLHLDDDYFQKVNEACLVDLNFDDWKDFMCEDLGSNGAISNSTLVYLFNPKIRLFEYTDDLFEGSITKIDSMHYKLIFINDFRRGSDSIVYCFDKAKSGKIISTESFRGYIGQWETGAWFHEEYIKTVDGEVVKTQRDSIRIE